MAVDLFEILPLQLSDFGIPAACGDIHQEHGVIAGALDRVQRDRLQESSDLGQGQVNGLGTLHLGPLHSQDRVEIVECLIVS